MKKITNRMSRRASKRMLTKARAKKIASIFEKKAELILKDTEEAVKAYFPKRHIKASLAKVAAGLAKQGVSCKFDTKITRTASDEEFEIEDTNVEVAVTLDELQEAVDAIVNATVDEFEALLEKADDVVDTIIEDTVNELDEEDDIDILEVEDEVKSDLEEELACMGVKAKLSRTKTKTAKRPMSKIRKAMPVRKPIDKKASAIRRTSIARPMRTAKRANPILAKMK